MTYSRPPLNLEVFRDAHGAVIAYGRRWEPTGSPADWAYSQELHPERFDPVRVAARALIEHLCDEYAVTAIRDGHSVRLVPSDGGAELQLTFPGDATGVDVRAGATGSYAFPVCGCDACDDDVLELINELEETVLAVADGRFSERLEARDLVVRVTAGDAYSQSEIRLDRKERKRVRALLPPNGIWKAWES